jgi:hypothetical protein
MNRSPMVIAFAIAVGVISWGSFSKCDPPQLPWPPQIIGAGLVFAVLDFVSAISAELSNVLAIGFIVAMLVSDEFKPNCNHGQGTAQPDAYQMLQGGGQPPQSGGQYQSD